MDISRDLKSHFSKFEKYITPDGIIFYDKKSYNMYIQQFKNSQRNEVNAEVEIQVL